MRNTVIGLAAAAAIITVGSTLSASACPYHQSYGGPGVSMVVASTVRSLVAVSTVASLSVVNIPAANLVAVSTVGNLRAVNVPAGSLVAANIPVGSIVAASTVNAAAMASIATERERQRHALQLFGTLCWRAV